MQIWRAARPKGTRLDVMQSDFTFELAMRWVLGVSTIDASGGPELGVIRQCDMAQLLLLVQRQLKEPAPRTVAVFP